MGDSPQEPIAIVGMACRLPGHCSSPSKLWDFLQKGGIATSDSPPPSRFGIAGHYDGSRRRGTLQSPGGMFLEDIDPAVFDAPFFNISGADATAMDPQQRQLLEVVYECLENSGITLEEIKGKQVGCFVGNYGTDYGDMQARDPLDRPAGITIGVGRAILSNRISHFLDIHGASMTIDTACSGGMVSVDVACRYLQTKQISGAIVAAANLYLSPEHTMDMGAMRSTASPTGLCHTFDAKADGYIKAEAVDALYIKLLSDAVRDGDPIRAVIRGTATSSDGRTPGIANPSPENQASAIRAAYANAGISSELFNETGYLECHGTGTVTGDPIEVKSAASVLGSTRDPEEPLIIGSIKANLGHSEPAAGISGLIKATLAVEKGTIPSNPTFIDPSPKIDFEGLRVRASRWSLPWPETTRNLRRASVNSFGYGGSNAHVVIENAQHFLSRNTTYPLARLGTSSYLDGVGTIMSLGGSRLLLSTSSTKGRPHVLLFSANDHQSLQDQIQALSKHLINPRVSVKMRDLSYTLSEKRTKHFYKAFLVSQSTANGYVQKISENLATYRKPTGSRSRAVFVFTGQGAQWAQMGKHLLDLFPRTVGQVLTILDTALQGLPSSQRPQWSLLEELTGPRSEQHLQNPELSQPLVTALQIALTAVLTSWGIEPDVVVGHSSGEIAAAYSAGFLTATQAIKVAYFRGLAAARVSKSTKMGMLAVGLGAQEIQLYLDEIIGDDGRPILYIACFNSPKSVTVSGPSSELDSLCETLKSHGHFARVLRVDLPYHTCYMEATAAHYATMLQEVAPAVNGCGPAPRNPHVTMVSTVTGELLERKKVDVAYWRANMESPVQFDGACRKIMTETSQGPNLFIEVGPSNVLSGPLQQVHNATNPGIDIEYVPTLKRGPEAASHLFHVAGYANLSGLPVSIKRVNTEEDEEAAGQPREPPAVIIDLPNYRWNHTKLYWHENQSSYDWRFKKFVPHDLLGSKALGSLWTSPSWRNTLHLEDVPWIRDHKIGREIIFPGAGYLCMAIEAVRQTVAMTAVHENEADPQDRNFYYHLRDVEFVRALVLEEDMPVQLMLSLSQVPASSEGWFQYRISSSADRATRTWSENCRGFVRVYRDVDAISPSPAPDDLNSSMAVESSGKVWYKAMDDAGYHFGPSFRKHLQVWSRIGKPYARSTVSLDYPPSRWDPQSEYPLHPACMDSCFQSVMPAFHQGDPGSVNGVQVPARLDNLWVSGKTHRSGNATSVTSSGYTRSGALAQSKRPLSQASICGPDGSLVAKFEGLLLVDMGVKENRLVSHTYSRLGWKVDFHSLDTDAKLQKAESGMSEYAAVQELLDLVAHKNPHSSVLEMVIDTPGSPSLWLTEKTRPYQNYKFSSNHVDSTVHARDQYSTSRNTEFVYFDPYQGNYGLTDAAFDLVIVTIADGATCDQDGLATAVSNALREGGRAIFCTTDLSNLDTVIGASKNPSEIIYKNGIQHDVGQAELANARRIRSTSRDFVMLADKVPPAAEVNGHAEPKVALVTLSDTKNELLTSITTRLGGLGWDVYPAKPDLSNITPASVALVLEEIIHPVLATISESAFSTVQALIGRGCSLVWVTKGSQMHATNPMHALCHGFFRTIRAEDPLINVITLDIESASPDVLHNTVEAINAVLCKASRPRPLQLCDSEFVERGGSLYVARVLPDQGVNAAKEEDHKGNQSLRMVKFDNEETNFRLVSERVGSLDALLFAEMGDKRSVPIPHDHVEVQILASGVNFKDVAVALGLVPGDPSRLGLDAAGVIVRVGEGVRDRHVGQRVVVFMSGCFANRTIVVKERTFPLPEDMTFEEAATMPTVYMTSIYGLYHLADLRKGQRVLIHSATGGVGLACIQLCRHRQCEIFATVGTDDKRKFLVNNFGIPLDHIFSSRSATFASGIRSMTSDYGVDVVMNSLPGDLLEEGWRLLAPGGTFIEIGKKDIIGRGRLPMEPFDLGCSFRAVDAGLIPPEMVAVLFEELFELVHTSKYVKPISPVQLFPYSDIPGALRHIRGGNHIGKLVISQSVTPNAEVLVRPPKRHISSILRPDMSYLIVGGLKGVCGSLAIHLAKQGANRLVIASRSNPSTRSLAIVNSLRALGCQVTCLQGDVNSISDVHRWIKEANGPIGGVIQGAMVLRDRVFASMSHTEFREATECKVQGTWNLHAAMLETQQPLSFFTMLASTSGLVGQKGQANYAAGNAFQDALAAYRHSLGLPATSINLGAIEDVGYIHQNDMMERFNSDIWTGINESLLRRILDYSLYQQHPDKSQVLNPESCCQLITGITVPQPADSELLRDARFAGLKTYGTGTGPRDSAVDGDKKIQALLTLAQTKGADPSVLLRSAVETVATYFGKLLSLSEQMDSARPLSVYGMDSLSALEFRNWVRVTLGVELTTLEVVNSASLWALCDSITSRMRS